MSWKEPAHPNTAKLYLNPIELYTKLLISMFSFLRLFTDEEVFKMF